MGMNTPEITALITMIKGTRGKGIAQT